MQKNNAITYRKDYQPPAYLIDQVDLKFTLHPEQTIVQSQLTLRENPEHASSSKVLCLNGEALTLLAIELDGTPLTSDRYTVDAEQLTITDFPVTGVLTIKTQINPIKNTQLSGLYVSRDIFCTQCEAEGFRRITYFLDRPDVLAKYTTKIIADSSKYPVLLSNGNLIGQGKVDAQYHWAKWADPFPKPCYLFALVAGDLVKVGDQYVTQSGKTVDLAIYVEEGKQDKCDHALRSLKKAMAWDEEKFGREYDLDIFNIVAVSDFNMGAMENKSLNIFNDACVLASPETATDTDYETIESIVAHEYFHNWTGNRITCRDWFQLSLKEGLTVYRDQEFSRDMNANDVMRIKDVKRLLTYQFAEDAGPLAHPVRPDSYMKIDNFYTTTVYEKGAEVVRMLQTIVGRAGFRRGMDYYFEQFDGQAVTIEDFVYAMEQANQIDLSQLRLWYSQAGTPVVSINTSYDASAQKYTLHVQQTCPPTPNQPDKQALCIPLTVKLLDPEFSTKHKEQVLLLTQATQDFEFTHIANEPYVSVLRDFSAPARLQMNYSDESLVFLMQHDNNSFACWQAGQLLAKRYLQRLSEAYRADQLVLLPPAVVRAYDTVLHNSLDPAFKAELLCVPGEAELAAAAKQVDVEAIHMARRNYITQLAGALQMDLQATYQQCHAESANLKIDAQVFGLRSLKNTCLAYLMQLATGEVRQMAFQQFDTARNMTDQLAALVTLADVACPEREEALQIFYQRWQKVDLVINKWLAIQAGSMLPNTLAVVQQLTQHASFTVSNPNKVRALIGTFVTRNPINFHNADGSGYRFLMEYIVQLNKLNPHMAAQLIRPFTQWRKYDSPRAQLMQQQLQQLLDTPALSKDCYEVVEKSLI